MEPQTSTRRPAAQDTRRNRNISSSRERSRERERKRRGTQADCIKRAGGFQKLADSEGHEPIRLFWDGFQWVAKTGDTCVTTSDPALMNSTRKLRRLYFGNLPLHLGLTEQNFQDIVYQQMRERNYCKDQKVNPVLYVWFAKDKGNYGFVEFATVEETERALSMDSMQCLGIPLKVSRPNDYTTNNSATVAMAQMGVQAAAQLVIGTSTQSGMALPGPPPGHCRCLKVSRMVSTMGTATVLSEEYADTLDDVCTGFKPYGSLLAAILISADVKDAIANDSVEHGDVYLVFNEAKEADQCFVAMSGRAYEGKPLQFERCSNDVIDTIIRKGLQHKEDAELAAKNNPNPQRNIPNKESNNVEEDS